MPNPLPEEYERVTKADARSYLEERIFNKINFEGEDGCWEWTGSIMRIYNKRSGGGYGEVRFQRKVRKAHIVVFICCVGPIPHKYQLDHTCFNKACVNPNHLEVVSPQENSIRARQRQTACVNGHEYTPENTILRKPRMRPGTQRVCRECYELRKIQRLALQVPRTR